MHNGCGVSQLPLGVMQMPVCGPKTQPKAGPFEWHAGCFVSVPEYGEGWRCQRQPVALPAEPGLAWMTSLALRMGTAAGRFYNNLETIVLLRWVLIVATSYLVLFSGTDGQARAVVALYIAVYLGSNVALASMGGRWRKIPSFGVTLLLFDILAVSLGLSLSGGFGDFFPVYFLVVLIGALVQRFAVAVGAAALIAVIDLSTVSRFVSARELIDDGYVLRIPFLIVVALFFGYVVEGSRTRERARRARERKRRRTEALSAVTHDLKNPLAVTQSFATLLLEGSAGPLNPQQSDMVLRIHANVRRVMHLAVNLLEAARIEAHRLVIETRPTDLTDVVSDALALSRSASELKGVTVNLVADRDLPRIAIDSVQMERVVTNLIDNAIKHSPSGSVVNLSVRGLPGRLVLRVQDSGSGIPPNILSGIFENYHRRSADQPESTGVGLFIVNAIVRAHGGWVDITSVRGSGTTVRVQLPLIRRRLAQRQPQKEWSAALDWQRFVRAYRAERAAWLPPRTSGR
jgi:signal transduction histidine kinase